MFLEAIKRKAVFYLFVIALMVFAAPFSKAQAKTKTNNSDYGKIFTKKDISYKIEETVCSAKSSKYSAQLCKIDGEYQVLYSKSGKSLSKINVEQKIKKELDFNNGEILELYYMTQFDDVFYICFSRQKNIDKNGNTSYSLISNPEAYYIAETYNFKDFTVHETISDPDRKMYVMANRFNPKLYKSGDVFFYLYSICTDVINIYDEGSYYFDIMDPVGYYGKSIDRLTEIDFEVSFDYNPADYDYAVYVEVASVVEGSKLHLYVMLEHNPPYLIADISEKAKNNTLYDFEADIIDEGSWGKLGKWMLNEIYDCAAMYHAEYEQFYTVAWNDEKKYSGVYGIYGQDKKNSFEFKIDKKNEDQLFDLLGIINYGCTVGAKRDKKGNLVLKSQLYISLDSSPCYRIDSKGKMKSIELPFSRIGYNGMTCTNTKKGWAAIVSDGYIYLSKDGFLTSRQIVIPCFNLVDIETYGNYLYVLSKDALYKLPVSL